MCSGSLCYGIVWHYTERIAVKIIHLSSSTGHVMFNCGNPTTPASMISPTFTGPTPSGVPVTIRSPASSVNLDEMCAIKDGMS
eukprot:m.122307 g.122307  ORF g.122307 m.122307 type:complete len:83 (-) comp28910_c2_seq1:567-815(-)